MRVRRISRTKTTPRFTAFQTPIRAQRTHQLRSPRGSLGEAGLGGAAGRHREAPGSVTPSFPRGLPAWIAAFLAPFSHDLVGLRRATISQMAPKLAQRLRIADFEEEPHRYPKIRRFTMLLTFAVLYAVPLLGAAR